MINPYRRLLLTALVGVPALSTHAWSKPRVPTWRGDPFALGVASGTPEMDGVVLWTRLIDDALRGPDPVPVRWEVFDEETRAVAAQGIELALSELGYSVHAEVSGLRPDRWYAYRFMAGDAVSATGRTRTLPLPTSLPNRLRFAFASCQNWESGYYSAYRHMAGENLDLVLFLGDYIYESPSRKNTVRPHGLKAATTLEGYRERYALFRSDPDLQRMHATCPWIVTWDDHEVVNNYAGSMDTVRGNSLLARRIHAYQAYYEHMPLRANMMLKGLNGLRAGAELRIYRHFDFGRLARIYVLDNRQYRDAPACSGDEPSNPGPCLSAASSNGSMLGKEQERWLDGAMHSAAKSGTYWNVFAHQTALSPRNYSAGKGGRFNPDGWDGYVSARERLLASLDRSGVRNPMFVGGNLHQNWVANIHRDPYDVRSPIIGCEFSGTSISSGTRTSQAQAKRMARMNPHAIFADSAHRGYGVVEVRQAATRVDLRALDDVKRSDASMFTLASFGIEAGAPGTERLGGGN